MATKIVTKNGSGAPLASDLVQGELAVDLTNKRLYTEDSGGNVIEVGVNPAAEIQANAGIALPDNQKATFGASDDLQIYHDGTNSYITDAGTGDLNISGDNLYLKKADGSKYLYGVSSTGQVRLYYGDAQKFITTSTGIDVTGTVVADGLTVDGTTGLNWAGGSASSGLITIGTGGSSGGSAWFNTPSLSSVYNSGLGISGSYASNLSTIKLGAYGVKHALYSSEMVFLTQDVGTQAVRDRLKLHNNGDISFYEDTGTTASLKWTSASTALLLTGRETSRTSGTYAFEVDNSAQNANMTAAGAMNVKGYYGNSFTIDGKGDISFYDDAGVAKFFWDASAESLGIGTSSPSAPLTVSGDTTQIRLENTASGGRNWALRTFGSALGIYDHTAGAFRQYIDSSGNVGIGTSSPSKALQVASGVSSDIARFENNAGGYTFGYSTALASLDLGASDAIRIRAGGTERARIDSSGNLLVGKTTTNFGTAGIDLRPDGRITSTRDGNTSLVLNRLTSDGSLIDFYKDGTTVGSIGTSGGDLYFSNGTSSLMQTGSNTLPRGATGGLNDATVNLGNASNRFKDLYLSGGVYLGGTGAANHLDDYEEGTWTPVSGAGNLSGTGLSYTGTYTKVGNLVTVHLTVTTTASDALVSSYQLWSGLPFTVAKTGTGTVITEDIDQFSRQGFAAVTGTSFGVSACGSATGTTRLDAIVTYIVA